MKKNSIIIIYLFFFASLNCQAQNIICFKVDINKAIKCGLFSPQENDTIIIRGSFNGWVGNDFSLEDKDNDGIYEQTFEIKSDSGVTHEFKYLILKSDGKILWEKQPNRQNKPHGCRILKSANNIIDEFDFDNYCLGVIGKEVTFSVEQMQDDFIQFRKTLEEQHCCLYEYTDKQKLDNLFDYQYSLIKKPLNPNEFFKILTPTTAKIGCGHTTVWMPGGYWDLGQNNLFPLQLRFIGDYLVITGNYGDSTMIPEGSILQEINDIPITEIVEEMRVNYSADAFNIHFINAQIERRFSLIYARRFGFADKFKVKYALPGRKTSKTSEVLPASNTSVKSVVFSNFNHPPLKMEIYDDKTAIITIPTFVYYDRVRYFTNFIDSCFTVIKDKSINNLILDLRGNDGGDPFCAAPLFSYLQNKPQPYFSQPYGKYSELANPISLPYNHFTGNLYTIIDGRCFSTNAHFCSLLKYHNIGKFVGTESGATYTCNAGKKGIEKLHHSGIQLYFGRSSFATAVKGMDKSKPIIPDYYVKETYKDLLSRKDVAIEKILNLINN